MTEPGEPEARTPHERPRWVRYFIIGVITLAVLAVAILLLTGDHGPGRHSASGTGGNTPIVAVYSPGHHEAGMSGRITVT